MLRPTQNLYKVNIDKYININTYINTMTETITIPKEEYTKLKRLEKLDFDLMRQFAKSLEDLKNGRFKRLA